MKGKGLFEQGPGDLPLVFFPGMKTLGDTTRPFLAALLLLGGVLLFFALRSLHQGGALSIPLDDGWIHLAFARNLATGRGFSLGAGAAPVSGSTAPLWTLLLSLPLALGIGPVASALGLGIFFSLLALWTAARLGGRVTGSPWGALWLAGGLALAPRFAWGTLSGMEIPLFTWLVLLGFLLFLEGKRPWAGVLAAATAGWARPECFALGAWLAALALFRDRRRERRGRTLGSVLPAFLLPLLAWFAFHYLVYGRFLPSTFYVKAASGSPSALLAREGAAALPRILLLQPLEQLLSFAGYFPGWNLFLAAGAAAAFLKKETRRPALVIGGGILFFAFARGILGFSGPWLQHGRYYTFLFPLWLALSAAGLFPAAPPSSRSLLSWAPHAAAALLLLAALFLLPSPARETARLFYLDDPAARPDMEALGRLLPWLLLLPALLHLAHASATALLPRPGSLVPGLALLGAAWFALALPPMAEAYARNVEDTRRGEIAMARWVAEHTPKNAVVACHDVGALGYFGNRKLLDLAGIATPEVLFWKKRRPGGKPDRLDYLRTKKPDYLCVMEGWFAGDLAGLAEDIRAGRLSYRLVHRIDLPGNVTLGGEHYLLFRMNWKKP